MNTSRRRQISDIILTNQLREKRTSNPVLAHNFVKVVKNQAVDAGIPAAEALEFARDIERELGR